MSKPKISNDTSASPHGRILALSAPSGAGKSTLAQKVVASTGDIVRSITYTTRRERAGEINGRDYHFISQGEFKARQQAGEFLESATVHGHLYGTSRSDVIHLCAQGLDVLLVIDYQGAAELRQQGVDALYIFILPPSLTALEQRLRQRNSDHDEALRIRLAVAPTEIAQFQHYDYVIVNDDLELATQQLRAIIVADRCRLERLDRRYPIFSELDG